MQDVFYVFQMSDLWYLFLGCMYSFIMVYLLEYIFEIVLYGSRLNLWLVIMSKLLY